MKVHHLHDWNLHPKDAIKLQHELSGQVIHDTALDVEQITLVAGVDVSVKDDVSQAAVVVLWMPSLTVVETVTATQPTPFPYVPGLLSFREGPVLVEAFEKLVHEPEAFIFDGMGRIHPRHLGIASHMGLWLERPTVGCGKSYLFGNHHTPGIEKGDMEPVMDHGEQLGMVVRTRRNVNPVYISPGHRANIDSAVELVMRTTPKYRLPEPVRQAHKAAGKRS